MTATEEYAYDLLIELAELNNSSSSWIQLEELLNMTYHIYLSRDQKMIVISRLGKAKLIIMNVLGACRIGKRLGSTNLYEFRCALFNTSMSNDKMIIDILKTIPLKESIQKYRERNDKLFALFKEVVEGRDVTSRQRLDC